MPGDFTARVTFPDHACKVGMFLAHWASYPCLEFEVQWGPPPTIGRDLRDCWTHLESNLLLVRGSQVRCCCRSQRTVTTGVKPHLGPARPVSGK